MEKKPNKGTICAAYNCSHYTGVNKEISFFGFPRDEERCQLWIRNIRRQDLQGKTSAQMRFRKLCGLHFEDSQFMNPNIRNSLVWNAIPTLVDVPNPPKPIQGKRPPARPRSLISMRKRAPKDENNGASKNADTEPCPHTSFCKSPSMDHDYAEICPHLKLVKQLKVEIQRLRVQVSKLRRKVKHGSKTNATKKKEIMNYLKQNLSSDLYTFFSNQLSKSAKAKGGYRWSTEIKSFSLSLFHQSPKCYKLLKKVFFLPSLSTLKRSMKDMAIVPGFSNSILEGLKARAATMTDSEKLCAIIFDEMSIKENLSYNTQHDNVEGLEDFGFSKQNYVANHAGVFFVRGLVEKWKQPVGYVLSSGPVAATDLKRLTLQCIDCVIALGLCPKVIICDQGSNNRSMLESLGVNLTEPSFTHSGHKIHVLYDPPHLIKNIRNNLKKTGFIVDDKEIKWTYIEQFYAIDSSMPVRMAKKLTEKHIELPTFSSMRVKFATQVLSHTVAAGITTLWKLEKLDEEAIHTAKFIEKIDSLFDVFNSCSLSNSKPLKRAITPTSPHFDFLEECFTLLSNLKQAGKNRILPCVSGWMLDIVSLKNLWEDLSGNHGVKFLLTNRLNQDCLENFFSNIRFKGGHRDNPTPVEFRAAYRAAAVDSIFVLSEGSNCEEDLDKFLVKVSSMSQATSGPRADSSLPPQMLNLLAVANAPIISVVEENILVYISGYLARKAIKFLCHDCLGLFVSHHQTNSENFNFLMAKQYSDLVEGGLLTPTDDLITFVTDMEAHFRLALPGIIHSDKVRGKLYTKISECVNLNLSLCSQCLQVKEYIIHLYVTVRLHHVLREQNERFRIPNLKRNRKVMKLMHI